MSGNKMEITILPGSDKFYFDKVGNPFVGVWVGTWDNGEGDPAEAIRIEIAETTWTTSWPGKALQPWVETYTRIKNTATIFDGSVQVGTATVLNDLAVSTYNLAPTPALTNFTLTKEKWMHAVNTLYNNHPVRIDTYWITKTI